MSAFIVERVAKGVSTDQLGAAQEPATAASQWQTRAESKWGATAVWIHGDGQFAVLQPCSDELTVTLCETLADATRAKKGTCCGHCSKSRHVVTDLAD